MVRIVAFVKPGSIGSVDEIGIWSEQLFDLWQILWSLSQLNRFPRACEIRPPAEPQTPCGQTSILSLHYEILIP